MKRANSGKPWLAAEIELLKHEYMQDLHPTTIAGRHGRTVGAVMGKLCSMGLAVPMKQGYYKVSADPWISFREVSAADRGESK
jgi:hypothetical protein